LLAIRYFDVYLNTTLKPVLGFTDHNPLVLLHKISELKSEVVAMEFDIT